MPCDACGGSVNPDRTADVLLCDACRRWVHAACVPQMHKALPLAWGEYVLWRYRCRDCCGGGSGGTLERRHHESSAPRVVARVAVLSAQVLAGRGRLEAAAAVTPAAAAEALQKAGSSTAEVVLGRVSRRELAAALEPPRAVPAPASAGRGGRERTETVSPPADPELRWEDGAVRFRRVRDVFPDLFRREIVRGGGGGPAVPAQPAQPARARAALLPSSEAGQWRATGPVRLAPLYGAAQHYTCELATDRRQPADWRVLASVTREADGVVIVPGSFVRLSVQLEGTLSMMPARVVDLLVSTRGCYAAYVQWLWTPAQVRAWLTRKVAEVVVGNDEEEAEWCAGVPGSKLEWLNRRRESPDKLVPDGGGGGGSGGKEGGTRAAVRPDIPAYPECGTEASTATAVREWARRAAKVVDVAAPPHPREVFFSLDADMIDLDKVAWEPATVHHLPAAEREPSAAAEGSCATCECVSDSRGSRGDYDSRWDHPARVHVALQRDPMLSAPVAAAVALAVCCTPPPSEPSPKRRRRRTSQRRSGPQQPQHHLLQLRPTRPQYVYTYGFNSVGGGFFALPEGVCLAAEVYGGRPMAEDCVDALVKAVRDGVPDELDLGAAAAEAAGDAGTKKRLRSSRMDAKLSIVLKAGPSPRVSDGPATGPAFVAEALGVSAAELAKEGLRATWLQKHFPAPAAEAAAAAAQAGSKRAAPQACSRYDPSVLDDAAEEEEPQVHGHKVAEDVMMKAYEALLAEKRGRSIEGISHVRLAVGTASPRS